MQCATRLVGYFRSLNLIGIFLLTALAALALTACEISTNEPADENVDQLQTLPYLQGTHKAPEDAHVTIGKDQNAAKVYNFYVSGHASEAHLIDMQGQPVHHWQADFAAVFPEVPAATDQWYDQAHWRQYWRRAHLLPNGDLLAIWEGNALVKLDRDSNVIWAQRGMFHHDLEVIEQGRIVVLDRRLAKFEALNNNNPILEDLITVLDSEGNRIEDHSIVQMWLDSEFAPILEHAPKVGDCFHTNTLEVLDGRFASKSDIFQKGNVLLSMRMFDAIAIADLKAGKIVWAQRPGLWEKQHQPTMLAGGNMMIYNNVAKLKNKDGYDASSIIEFDPLTMKVHWKFEGTPKVRFFSDHSGSNQRLANGNTVITETAPGRAFEITPEGKIVWEYINPYRTGDRKQYIAALYELLRVDPGDYELFFLADPQP